LLDALKDESPTRAFGHDRKLRYTWATGDVFGRAPSELQGKTDADVFGAAALEGLVAIKTAARDDGTAARGVVDVEIGGKARRVLLYAEPTRDKAGDVSALVCVATELQEDA
jgi:hypothetical protein